VCAARLGQARDSHPQSQQIVSVTATAPAIVPRSGPPSLHLVGGMLVLLLVGIVTTAPVVVVILGSFDGDAWLETLSNPVNRNAILASVVLALRAPIAAVLGFLIAWLLIRIKLPGGKFLEFAMWITFFLPILPLTLSWILLLSPRYGIVNLALEKLPFISGAPFNIYSIGGILWVHLTASSVPVMVVLLGPAIRQLDASYEEVGRVCGLRPFAIFRQITLPILMPAILTAALAGFIKSLEAFEVERILGPPANIFVYSTRIYDLISWEPPLFNDAMALSALVLSGLLALAIVYQKWMRHYSYATILGREASRQQLDIGPAAWAASAILFLIVAISLFFPLVTLLLGSFMKLFGFFSIPSPYVLAHWRQVFADPVFLHSLWNSLLISTGAGLGGVFIYSMIAYLLVRSRIPGRNLVELLTWLPWTIPGILLSVACLSLMLSTPLSFLYGSILSLILILIISQMPIGVHMMKTSVLQIGTELEHSARLCGAGPIRTFFAIILPLIRPMLVSIFVIVFISAIRDISTIIFMANANTKTLSLLMLEFAASSNLEDGAVIGVVTTAIVIVVAALARRFGLNLFAQR